MAQLGDRHLRKIFILLLLQVALKAYVIPREIGLPGRNNMGGGKLGIGSIMGYCRVPISLISGIEVKLPTYTSSTFILKYLLIVTSVRF